MSQEPKRDPLDSLKVLHASLDPMWAAAPTLAAAIAAWTQERERTAAHEKEAMETMAGQQGLVDSLREKIAKLEAEMDNRDALASSVIAKLESENARLRTQLKGKTFPLDQALNEGDGTYKP
jgi:uncharacterized protein YlxW (UPF0749 family)